MNEQRPAMELSPHVVLVCDVHHFSKLSVELVDRVPSFMEEFYCTVGEIAVSHGGRIVKYIGDCIFFLFDGSSHVAAAQSAVEMRQAFTSLLSRFRISCESEIETGISAGDLYVGEIGHPTHRVTEVFGNAVNEASLIGCYRGITLTAAVKEQIESKYETRRLTDISTKWSEQPLPVWEVIGLKAEGGR
jgi:class 3 adenylate cyclase